MIRIVATPEQIRQLNNTSEGIELVDEPENCLGIVALQIDLEDIRIAGKRLNSDQPRLTYAEVLEHVHALKAS